ncbi:hypothetical protein [Cohnella panacarvi]|uniref:hypothetical protein n=1 Tax=Cohnella panacarvi TaxID=400776 RepID=UPI00047D5B6F|nr:hypothetical protein [Cohnella panacarvi]
MNKKRSTTLALSSAVLALMLITAACSNNDGNANPSNNANVTPSPSPTVTASSETGGESSAEPSTAPETHPGEGEYVGLIDSHSIEVKLEDSTVAFQIGPEIAEKVDQWESGTLVTFTYSENKIDVNGETVTQYTIHSIDKQ